MGFPWIGETLQFYRAQQNNKLYQDFLHPRTRKHGNIFKTRFMGEPMVIVSGVEANRFFLSNEFKLVVSSWPTSSVLLMGEHSIMTKGGDLHRWLRAALAACINGGSAMESLAPKICASVSSYLEEHWQGRDTVCLFPSMKRLTFTVVCECLLGIEAEASLFELFERVLCGVFKAPIGIPGSRFWRAKRARTELGRRIVGLVRERRREMEKGLGGGGGGGSDAREGMMMLLTRLVRGLMEGEISEEEVTDNVVLFTFAAHDTTALAVSMMCRMVAHHPDCYARLQQEHDEIMGSKRGGESLTWEDVSKMKYTWEVARESLRLYPPIFGSFRKAIIDIQYQGFTIPKGWKVLWTAYGTHYDPQYFPDPQRFDPSRFEDTFPPYAYLPFGGGTRMCAGYQLAKLNMLIFMHFMLTRYNWQLVCPNEPIKSDPLPFPSLGMPIRLAPRNVSFSTSASSNRDG